MPRSRAGVLAINGGSSSIRFAIFAANELRLSGKMDRLGLAGSTLLADSPVGKADTSLQVPPGGQRAAVDFLLDWLAAEPAFATVGAVGHRLVHGMQRSEPELVTPKLLKELRRIAPFAPEHLPREIQLIEAFRERHPKLPQVACFDTAFHRTMPPVARLLPIPRRYAAKRVERYGFHGLSYAYLMDALRGLDSTAAKGRVILAHLGGGASLVAVRNGRSIDTSMGVTPAAGLMMGTRTGDVDPGLMGCLIRTQGMTAAGFERMANHEAGLLGVSGISSDMRELLARENEDTRAAEAIGLFCYQAKKWIGSFAAALGGLDALVFSGGIGENAPAVRERICAGLEFLGISVDKRRNARGPGMISRDTGGVRVYVVPTNEELMIAKLTERTVRRGKA